MRTRIVRGIVDVRPGTTLPANASVIVTVRRHRDILAQYKVPTPLHLPHIFAVTIEWPTGKAFPAYSVDVGAHVEIDNQRQFFSETQIYRQGDFVKLPLIPVRE